MQGEQDDLFPRELAASAPPEQYPLYDGTPPHVRGSDTSLAAAEAIEPHVGTQQARALAVVRAALAGATCDEVEALTGGRHQGISARLRELVQLGKIVDSGQRRATRSGRQARIYVAVRRRAGGA